MPDRAGRAMKFNLDTLLASLVMAGVIYAIQIFFVAQKIERQITSQVTVLPGIAPPPPPPTTGEILARYALYNLPVLLVAGVGYSVVRRRLNRRRPSHCSACGEPLLPAAHRCEVCGERRLSCGTNESLFPVPVGRHAGPQS
ncbi:MAG TPA: hypothetical protein VF796_07220 [Humisphaera sp.]